MDSDAEWIDVDKEFGGALPALTPRPRPRPRPTNAPPRPPVVEPPHDAPEKAPSNPSTPTGINVGLVAGCVGGILGVVLVLLLMYMVVLRRRLSKAKSNGKASHYQLRVEDVAHLSNLDETTNTYVNTTDLQKLVASVRARGKSENRLPTPPRLLYQTPAPYRPDSADSFDDDTVVVRAPMPPPHTATTTAIQPQPSLAPQPSVEEVMYSNLEEYAAPPRPTPRLQPPTTSPPPPPIKEVRPNSQPSRPAPAPPNSRGSSDTPSPSAKQTPQAPSVTAKPTPPCPTLKPGIGPPSVQARVGAKPTPATPPKPSKGKALPPLKMILRGSVEGASSACVTPDTAHTLLSPDSTPTPTPEASPGMASISAKIALLEGHMRQAGGGMSRPGGVKL